MSRRTNRFILNLAAGWVAVLRVIPVVAITFAERVLSSVRVERSITIAGGGLAGLTLGILLRQENVRVEIQDAGTYPRHRVCGECFSGRGLEILKGLGLEKFPEPLGQAAGSLRFFTAGRSTRSFNLPHPALSVDRSALDSLLADEFRKRGGILRENFRWTECFAQPGVVRATGRRLDRNGTSGEHRYIGLKVHARNLPLSADVELHFSPEGYVGLSRLRDGTVNICGLFRKIDTLPAASFRDRSSFARVLSGEVREGIASAVFDKDSFSAVAGISLEREHNLHAKECRIGDSLCMIPPLTGNGMSLAVESAAVAAPTLRDYARGTLEWEAALGKISQNCEKAFGGRMRVAAILQRAVFSARGRLFLLSLLRTAPRMLNLWFHATR